MSRTLAARLERIEPKARAAWERVWRDYAAKVERAIPDAVLEHAMRAPDDEAAWSDFQAAHGLEELVGWHDRHDALPVDPDSPDLRHWPHTIPTPPPEPPGVWEAMHQLREGNGDAAAFASIAVLVLGLARCVREVHE